MQLEEVRRRDLRKSGLQEKPLSKVTVDSLKELDIQLEYIFDIDSEQWHVYRVHRHGLTKSDDILRFQVSLPKNSEPSSGVKRYLEKFDRNPGGMKDADELKKEWLNQFKEMGRREREYKEYHKRELLYHYDQVLDWWVTERKQVVVPKQVGFNTKTNRGVYAVPKKKRELNVC